MQVGEAIEAHWCDAPLWKDNGNLIMAERKAVAHSMILNVHVWRIGLSQVCICLFVRFHVCLCVNVGKCILAQGSVFIALV